MNKLLIYTTLCLITNQLSGASAASDNKKAESTQSQLTAAQREALKKEMAHCWSESHRHTVTIVGNKIWCRDVSNPTTKASIRYLENRALEIGRILKLGSLNATDLKFVEAIVSSQAK